jgi:hypothetical protein
MIMFKCLYYISCFIYESFVIICCAYEGLFFVTFVLRNSLSSEGG